MVHPSSELPADVIDTIRRHAAAAEQQGQLTTEQLELIYQRRWFHLFVPSAYGGSERSLPEAVRLEESIAFADGSVGWVVTLCAGAAMFIGYFDQQLAREVFSDPRTCLAGSGQATGTAKVIDDGYEVTGSWPYSSGAPHATHFTANCAIEKNGKPLLQADGQPSIRSFLFKKEEVSLEHNWNYMGLRATAGHSYSVAALKVSANRSFLIDAAHAQLPQPVYRYPFRQLAETTICANISGMCLNFLDLAGVIIEAKVRTLPRDRSVRTDSLSLLSEAVSGIRSLRTQFYDALGESWQSLIEYNHIDAGKLAAVSESSLQLAQQARNHVNLLYPYCGLMAARMDTDINRVWRNINTASQHALLNGV